MTNPAENAAYVAQTLCSMLIQNCPKDQANLVSTIGFDVDSKGNWSVFIGGSKLLAYAKAPYAGYTNELREDKKILHYIRVYPGQQLTGWINRTIEQCCRLMEAY